MFATQTAQNSKLPSKRDKFCFQDPSSNRILLFNPDNAQLIYYLGRISSHTSNI